MSRNSRNRLAARLVLQRVDQRRHRLRHVALPLRLVLRPELLGVRASRSSVDVTPHSRKPSNAAPSAMRTLSHAAYSGASSHHRGAPDGEDDHRTRRAGRDGRRVRRPQAAEDQHDHQQQDLPQHIRVDGSPLPGRRQRRDRALTGVSGGEIVKVTLDLDTAPHEVEVPRTSPPRSRSYRTRRPPSPDIPPASSAPTSTRSTVPRPLRTVGDGWTRPSRCSRRRPRAERRPLERAAIRPTASRTMSGDVPKFSRA